MHRRFSEVHALQSFAERFRYLALNGQVAESTFGSDRWINQRFYRSAQWKQIRQYVLDRDQGCDLGIEGYEIFDRPIIHHMNPMSAKDIVHADPATLDPEFLITTTHRTHNAIHYGDERQLPRSFTERTPGDTLLWGKERHNGLQH